MPPRRATRSASIKSTPQSPPKPGSSGKSIDTRARGKRTTTSTQDASNNNQQLLPNIAQVLAPVSEDIESGQSGVIDGLLSPSDQSVTDSSDFETDLNELDRDAIIDNLMDLYDDSKALISSFARAGAKGLDAFIGQVTQTGSPQRRRFLQQARRLLRTREPFGDNDMINPSLIACRIAGINEPSQLGDAPWRPDAIVYQANIALQLIVLFGDPPDGQNYLPFMYNNFPLQFASLKGGPYTSTLTEDTFNVLLDVFTQFYIFTGIEGSKESSFDPDQQLQQIFWDEDGLLRGSYDDASKYLALKRANTIKQSFNTDIDEPINFDRLKDMFPWHEFLGEVVKWSVARSNELDGVIERQNGVETIVDTLIAGEFHGLQKGSTKPKQGTSPAPHERVEKHTAQVGPAHVVPNFKSSKPTSGRRMRAELQLLRDEKARHAAEVSGIDADLAPTTAQREVQEIPQSPTPVEGDDDDRSVASSTNNQLLVPDDAASVDEGPDRDSVRGSTNTNVIPSASQDDIVPTQTTALIMQTLARQAAEREKENRPAPVKRSLLDRQPTATREVWSPGADEGGHATPRPKPRASRPPAAREGSESSSGEGDEDFEQDTRPIKKPRLNSRREAAEEQGVDARDDAHGLPADGSALTSHAQSSRQPLFPIAAPASRAPASTTQPTATRAPIPPTAPSPPPTQASIVNLTAKMLTAQSRERRHPRAQVRIPWTVEETNRLMEMVELYGTRWAYILEMDREHEDGPRLQNRDQVPLKDKARNIKLDFLKARQRLPNGFQFVTISKGDIARLHDLGIDYVPGRYTGRRLGEVDDEEE